MTSWTALLVGLWVLAGIVAWLMAMYDRDMLSLTDLITLPLFASAGLIAFVFAGLICGNDITIWERKK